MRAGVLLMLCLPAIAVADPCDGIERGRDEAALAPLAPAIGRQLGVRGVRIREALRHDDWQVFLISARDADDSIVFYSGDPLKTRFVDAIGTFALPAGEKATHVWLVENLDGMPTALAACVANVAVSAASS